MHLYPDSIHQNNRWGPLTPHSETYDRFPCWCPAESSHFPHASLSALYILWPANRWSFGERWAPSCCYWKGSTVNELEEAKVFAWSLMWAARFFWPRYCLDWSGFWLQQDHGVGLSSNYFCSVERLFCATRCRCCWASWMGTSSSAVFERFSTSERLCFAGWGARLWRRQEHHRALSAMAIDCRCASLIVCWEFVRGWAHRAYQGSRMPFAVRAAEMLADAAISRSLNSFRPQLGWSLAVLAWLQRRIRVGR